MGEVNIYWGGQLVGPMTQEELKGCEAWRTPIQLAARAMQEHVEKRKMGRRPYGSHLRCPHCGKGMMVEAVIRRGEEDLVHVCWSCSYEEMP